MQVVWDNLPLLLAGAGWTLVASVSSVILGLAGAIVLNVCLLSLWPMLRVIARVYISVLRGTPMLLQLLIAFYVPSHIGLNFSPLAAGIIALSMNTAAFQAEILRGAFNAFPSSQLEAATVIGLGPLRTRLRIQTPQVFRAAFPAWLNEFTLLIKNSSLVSVIGVAELTRRSQEVVSASFEPAQVYTATAILYLVITLALGTIAKTLRNRGLGAPAGRA